MLRGAPALDVMFVVYSDTLHRVEGSYHTADDWARNHKTAEGARLAVLRHGQIGHAYRIERQAFSPDRRRCQWEEVATVVRHSLDAWKLRACRALSAHSVLSAERSL